MPTPLAPAAMRQVNRGATLRILAANRDPVTLSALAVDTGLSRRTVELIVADLMATGWAEEVAPADPIGAGRPARRFVFVPRAKLVLAAQLDMHHASVMLADLRGDVVARGRRSFASNDDPEVTTAMLREEVEAILAQEGVDASRIVAGTIAQGGTVMPDGTVNDFAPKPRWRGYSAARALTDGLGIPFVGDNDANLSALAEHERGVARGENSFVWLVAGRRSGAGIVVDGLVHRGVSGAAGELVRAPQLGLDALEEHPIGGLTSVDAAVRKNALAVVAAAREGQATARYALDQFADRFAGAIVTLAWVLAPPLFVLGAGLEDAADLLIPALEARLAGGRTPPIRIEASVLGVDAALLGGVSRSLAEVDARIFGPTMHSDVG